MASSKKSVTASKPRTAKSAAEPKSAAAEKPALKGAASVKGKTAAPAKPVAAKTEGKADGKSVAKTAAKTSVKPAAKPAAKNEVRAVAKASVKNPSKTSAAKTTAAKAPEKTAPAASKPAAKAAAQPAKAAPKAAEPKLRAAAKAAAAAPSKVSPAAETKPAKKAVKNTAIAEKPAKPAAAKPEKAAMPSPAVETKPAKAAAQATARPASTDEAEKIAAAPEPTQKAGVGQKDAAGTARKAGAKGAKAAPVPVQPVVRLAPARLAMGSSAAPVQQNTATKDDSVKAPQTMNAGKTTTTASATGAPVKAGEKAAAKPGAHRTGFKVNEFIVYPAHGVGQIIAIEEQEVAGFKLELFVISFMKDKMTLKVPMPKVVAGAIRKLADAETVQRALDTLTGRARVKRTMWSRRAQEYEAKINSGDLQAIAEVVRDLYRSGAQPEQSYSERQLYEAALDRMARELAAVNKLTDTEALKLIESQLQKGPRRGGKADAEADAAEDADEDGEDGVEEAA